MWKQSWVWLNRVDLFGEGQYVMGDKGESDFLLDLAQLTGCQDIRFRRTY